MEEIFRSRLAPACSVELPEYAFSTLPLDQRRFHPDVFETRPTHIQLSKQGDIGTDIKLQTNFFKILTPPDWCLYKYVVNFISEKYLDNHENLLSQYRDILGAYMYNGSFMYTTTRYANDPLILSGKSFFNFFGTDVRIRVRLCRKITSSDPDYIHYLDIITRRIFKPLELRSIEGKYFDDKEAIKIPEHQLDVWSGYQASIRPYEYNLLMNINITSQEIRHETVLDIINKIRVDNPFNLIEACKAQIIGLRVYIACNNSSYNIVNIDFNDNPSSKFTLKKDGPKISFIQYYQQKYNIQIEDMEQPILFTNKSISCNPDCDHCYKDFTSCLIPELCRVIGLSHTLKNDDKIMNALATHINVSPDVQMNKILELNNRLQVLPAAIEELKQWNLKIDDKLLEIPSRVLPPVSLKFNKVSISAAEQEDWTLPLQRNVATDNSHLFNWVLICPNEVESNVKNFVRNLVNVSRDISFNVQPPRIKVLEGETADEYIAAIREVRDQYLPQIVGCILREQCAELYSAIMKTCCVHYPTICQVILQSTLKSKDLSIIQKIAIKLCCKIGEIPWTVNLEVPELMVVGYRADHDAHDPNHPDIPSGAMVATWNDDTSTHYFSAATYKCITFVGNMEDAIKNYIKINKKPPLRIIIYREGVDHSEIPKVSDEVKYLRSRLEKLYKTPEGLRIAYVLVTKTNVRLFYNHGNPPAGTIVDDVITSSSKYDFYLVSQHVESVPASPMAYNIIYDSTGLDVSTIQQLTYKLTHMYFNKSGAIAVPAPCQYAHKLALLVNQHIHSQPSSRLQTSLFYL